MDAVLSVKGMGQAEGFVPLLVGHHVARVAYEGADSLRSGKPNFGVPELAVLLNEEFPAITARARHVGKLLDNSSTTYESVLRDFEALLVEHRGYFPAEDLGVQFYQGSVVGATIPSAYRLGIEINDDGRIEGEDLLTISTEWGRTHAVLAVASLDLRSMDPTLDLTSMSSLESVDFDSRDYLSRRFEAEFSDGLKLLLLAIEGDLNTSRLLLPQTASGHEVSVARTQTVTLYHSIKSLSKIAENFSEMNTVGMNKLRGLLDEPPTSRLASNQGLKVRDRCVHYPILNPTIVPDFSHPMYGIIENVFPFYTWETFYEGYSRPR